MMTVQEIRDIFATLPGEMTLLIAGEQQCWELGGLDWAEHGLHVYLVAGDTAQGTHTLPSLTKDRKKSAARDTLGE